VIRVRFGARHVARLSDRQILWQGENSGQPGFTRAVCWPNQTISARFYNAKEGPLRMLEAVPLYCPHYGKWRHMPPREFESLSPPWWIAAELSFQNLKITLDGSVVSWT
jgi:hypothetical protein